MIDYADNVTHGLPVTTDSPIRLQFSSPERIYTVLLMQDLFNQWVIMQTWSGKQQTKGGSKLRPFDDMESALAALAAIAHQHEKRGLLPVH